MKAATKITIADPAATETLFKTTALEAGPGASEIEEGEIAGEDADCSGEEAGGWVTAAGDGEIAFLGDLDLIGDEAGDWDWAIVVVNSNAATIMKAKFKLKKAIVVSSNFLERE